MNILPKVILDDKIRKREIKYLNKDYSDFKQSLIEFTKAYFPDTYQDFNESSPGSVFLDMAAFVGDVLSLYIDKSFRENLLAYAEEKENVVSLAQAMGLRIRDTTPSVTTARIYQVCPADVDGNIDAKFLLRLDAGSRFGTNNDVAATPLIFRSIDLVDFSNPLDRSIQIYSLDQSTGLPTSFLISKPVKLTSGEKKQFQISVSSPQRFQRIRIPDTNIIGIESVIDSDGNEWNEVENLAQDVIFEDTYQTAVEDPDTVAPAFTMRLIKTDRRFVTRLTRTFETELVFGGGNGSLDDAIINFDPKQVYDSEYNQTVANTPISEVDLTTANTFGLAPSNTTLTISYIKGGGVKDNVPANTITNVLTPNVVNDTNNYSNSDQSIFNTAINSLSVTNPSPASGGADAPSTEEIRQIALAYFSAQNRVVTTNDYAGRILAMPGRYGAVSKVFVTSDEQINRVIEYSLDERNINNDEDPNNNILYVDNPPMKNSVKEGNFTNAVNVYMLGYDRDRRLANLNTTVKENVRKYLSSYRMLTDQVNLYDAFIVNISVVFDITVFKNYNLNDTLARSMDVIQQYFNIDNWQINQPIVLSDLQSAILAIDGVQSLNDLSIKNKYQQRDGRDYQPYTYNIPANTQNGVILPSVDPCIFELRYPTDDIIGNARQ